MHFSNSYNDPQYSEMTEYASQTTLTCDKNFNHHSRSSWPGHV